jgi:hypothetical protein
VTNVVSKVSINLSDGLLPFIVLIIEEIVTTSSSKRFRESLLESTNRLILSSSFIVLKANPIVAFLFNNLSSKLPSKFSK